MKNTVRISKEEYYKLMEYKYKQLFGQIPTAPYVKEIDKQKKVIKEKDDEIAELKATIARQDKLLTEQDLYEKKKKETAPTGVPAIDATVDRLLKLEAKFEAQENPYFF